MVSFYDYNTYQTYILLTLAAIIYFYGGWPFLKGLTQEVRKLQPGMMTLIGTAISVAFFFSAATVFFPVGSDFFWELATLIDVMLLGHWIEARIRYSLTGLKTCFFITGRKENELDT